MRAVFKKIVIALIAAAVLTAIALSGILNTADGALSDKLYLRSSSTDGEIVIIGMDQYALETLGPMPWPRSYMADVINQLNSDPANRPAVIGVDVLYVGESSDPDADAALVAAAETAGNVVFAAAATFASELVTDGDNFYMDEQAVVAWDAPFDALAEVSAFGHINIMADDDGIIRHGMHYIDAPGVGRIPSFAHVLHTRYAEYYSETTELLPSTENEFFYIPFTAEAGGYYDGVSFVDVLDGCIEPEYFSGKIVLIGPYTVGLQDEYRAAIDHAAPMYGIELVANQIDAFRSGRLPQEVGNTVQLILLFLWSLALAFVFRNRKVGAGIAIWLATSVGWILLSLLLYRMGWVLHVLWFPLASTVLFIASVAVNYIRASREKKRITSTFGRYVDPAILKELLVQGGSGEELGGKLFEIAVLFVDIRGFTTMSEALDPPTIVEILNRYLTLTTKCIMRYHGTLDKFVGDCTMAFWNAPLPQEDSVYLACCAAMDMVEGSKALGEELQSKYGRTVSFGVGVHVGPAVVGNIGAPQRMDYTAIGDTVNTSARLEANAPGGTVLISRAVADALGDRAQVTSLGDSIKLKGKAEGFECLTLDALERERKD